MAPEVYDPNSAQEVLIPLPSAPRRAISKHLVVQEPLSRRGRGPGIFLFLPHDPVQSKSEIKSLDPEPVQKWAEEGYVTVAVIWQPGQDDNSSLDLLLAEAVKIMVSLDSIDNRDSFGALAYDPVLIPAVQAALVQDSRFRCLISFGAHPDPGTLPCLVHLVSQSIENTVGSRDKMVIHRYPSSSPKFVLSYEDEYDPGSAALAHTRTLVFLRKWLGGPFFDLEEIWEEHTRFEFEERSVAKTMGTMVQEPYVNHIPTLMGGIGREALTSFYRDHFIFANPSDLKMVPISRTVGPDRIVDEFVLEFTHNKIVDWLMPGVPPSNCFLRVPMLGVVCVRGDRLYNEHIYWDQATALKQAGVLPSEIPYPSERGKEMLRLPIAGSESAKLLVNEKDGKCNEMLGWGVRKLA